MSTVRVPYTTTRGERPVWLLDLDIGGHIVRVATEQVDVTTAGGSVLRYRGGLTAPRVRVGDAPDRVAVEVDDLSTDWALHVARGGGLDRRRAELRLWFDGPPASRGKVVIAGGITRPEYGEPRAPTRLVFEIVTDEDAATVEYPPANEVVGEETFAIDLNGSGDSADEAVIGQPYPTVIGRPGGDFDGSNPPPASPALAVSGTNSGPSRVMVCRGRVEANNVWIHKVTENDGNNRWSSSLESVLEGTDLLGQTYSYVSMSSGGGRLPWGTRLYAGWGSSSGGFLQPDGTLLRGLGDVIHWAMLQSGGNYDHASQASHMERLNKFKVDTFIAGDRFNLVDWLSNRVASVFPIRKSRSRNGHFFAYVPHTGTLDDAVAWLDADRNRITRASSIVTNSTTAGTKFEIRYQRHPEFGNYRRTRILAPTHADGGDNVIGDKHCARARAVLGHDVEAKPIETELIWDDTTAVAVVQHIAARHALPLPRVEYVGSDLAYLQQFQVVAITDSQVHLAERPALIESVEFSGREQKLTLSLLPGLTATS